MINRYVKLVETLNSNNVLYHGTTYDIADEIIKNGFKLTKGKRSGFLGAEKEVENLGIFLSDNKALAYAYGKNRDKYDGRNTTVLKVAVEYKNIIDMSDWKMIPLEIRKKCLSVLSNYEQKKVTKPTQNDMFWFFDRLEIVEFIKSKGYDGIKFLESKKTKKELGVPNVSAFTYMIFDPQILRIVR